MRLCLNILFLCVMMCGCCFASEIDVESLFDGNVQNEEQSILLEYLELLQQSPMNVNQVSAKELCRLPWISPLLAARIIQYRHDHGEFKRLEDLQNVRGIKSSYDKIAPFLTTGKTNFSMPLHVQGRHRIMSPLQQSKAYQEDVYAGTKEKVYNRIHGTVSEVARFGMLIEKDAGERPCHDFFAGHLVFTPSLPITVLLGNFTAEYAQGLVFSGPYRMMKSSDPVAPAKQRSRGIAPFLSTTENYAFSGVGISSRIKMVEISAFTSQQKRDARLEENFITSLPETGLHRTANELAIKDKIVERVNGYAAQAQIGKNGHIGGVVQHMSLNYPFAKGESAQAYDFSGDYNQVVGLNGDLTVGSINTFAEMARSKSGGQAVLAGMWYDLSPLECVVLYRHYDADFHNFYGLGFGERAETQNENGFYVGLRARFNAQTTMNLFFDQWHSDWLQTFVPMPSSGYELLFSVEHQASSFLNTCLQCRVENKDAGTFIQDAFGNDARIVTRPQRSKVRLDIKYQPARTIRFRTRLEFTDFSHDGQLFSSKRYGTLLYQDLFWQPKSSITCQTRWTLFEAPSYEHRFYQFENDLPGIMRLTMLNGRGRRWYLLCGWRPSPLVKINLKYENLYMDDQQTIGSGNDIIFSQNAHAVSLQFDWQF